MLLLGSWFCPPGTRYEHLVRYCVSGVGYGPGNVWLLWYNGAEPGGPRLLALTEQTETHSWAERR